MDSAPVLHPTDSTVRSYSLRMLGDEMAASVAQHLDRCPECRRRLAEISGDRGLGRPGDEPLRLDETIPAESSLEFGHDSRPAAPAHSGALPDELAGHAQYRVVRELGRGGMGVVYLAHNRLMDRLEVLKVLSKTIVDRGEVVERFLREIRSAARLGHPNVVAAYSALRLGDLLVFSMEYVEGEDLSAVVRARGPLPVAHACFYAYQAALGLQHAHERGMVHRDIKPGNLILTKQGKRQTVKILDFGLAKVTSEEPVDGSLTRDGQILGTPDYLAPEQSRDAQKADIRADIYSLGCTLYYLLAGEPPFRGTSLLHILQSHQTAIAPTLDRVRTEVPEDLAGIVAKMIAKEPDERFQTPGQVASALVPFFKPGAASPPPFLATEDIGPTRTRRDTKPGPDTEPQWATLIEMGESEPILAAKSAGTTRGRAPWLGLAMTVVALLVGFVVAAKTGVLAPKDVNGVVVFQDLPKDAEVFVDGKQVSVAWPGGGTNAELTAASGKRLVQVKKKGYQTFEDDVSVEAGGRSGFRAQLAPIVVQRKAQVAAKPTVPANAREFQGKHYQLFPEHLTWSEAREKCRALGGHLARVNNAEENQFLVSLLTERAIESTWLGATDEKEEGEWLWLDGSPLTYTNWDQGQPNNNGDEGEHYLLLWVEHDGRWTDQPDDSDRHQPGYICQWD